MNTYNVVRFQKMFNFFLGFSGSFGLKFKIEKYYFDIKFGYIRIFSGFRGEKDDTRQYVRKYNKNNEKMHYWGWIKWKYCASVSSMIDIDFHANFRNFTLTIATLNRRIMIMSFRKNNKKLNKENLL